MKLSIGFKISTVFAAIVVCFAGLAFYTSLKINQTEKIFHESSHVYGQTENVLARLRSVLFELEMVSERIAQTPSDSDLRYQFVNAYRLTDSLFVQLKHQNTMLPDSIQVLIEPMFTPFHSLLKEYQAFQQNSIRHVALNDVQARTEMLAVASSYSSVHLNSHKLTSQLKTLTMLLQTIHENQDAKIETIIDTTKRQFTIGGVLLFILIISMAIVSISLLLKPIRFINQQLSLMGKGMLPCQPLPEGSDELGHMAINLNILIDGLRKISLFANEMGKGNFGSKFEPLSEKDTLGNALLSMREELKTASEEEAKRKEEDQQRNWASQGIARFSEILRENNNNIEDLSFNVISHLVKYVGANQGGLFVLNHEQTNDAILEMSACYAYDRKKFMHKTYALGEGLIGRCAQENESIFLTEIPKGYTEITSGLGNDDPTCLFIVPLNANEKVLGAIELAAFEVLQPYKLEFIEKIAESIASTLATVKINIQTKQLLEQSRRQAEDMATQEQEMRQNMEQLRATQEQSAKKEAELLQQINALKG